MPAFRTDHWLPAGSTFWGDSPKGDESTNRFEFVGTRTKAEIRKKYLGRSVDEYLKKYAQNPVKYVNC